MNARDGQKVLMNARNGQMKINARDGQKKCQKWPKL